MSILTHSGTSDINPKSHPARRYAIVLTMALIGYIWQYENIVSVLGVLVAAHERLGGRIPTSSKRLKRKGVDCRANGA